MDKDPREVLIIYTCAAAWGQKKQSWTIGIENHLRHHRCNNWLDLFLEEQLMSPLVRQGYASTGQMAAVWFVDEPLEMEFRIGFCNKPSHVERVL